LLKIGPLKVTDAGLINAFFMAVRLTMLIIGTSIMTLTTSPISLTDGMEHCMRVIPGLRSYAHELAMMMTIALRFIPTLMEEADKIMKAQKARGADFETGNIFKKAKSIVPILVPLFIGSFKRADELAMAMEARCYRGGANRTRLNELHYSKNDTTAYIITALMTALIIASRFLPLMNIPIR
jgi:energy-coupling factor transport system permease protein